jgi:hypothetical protein
MMYDKSLKIRRLQDSFITYFINKVIKRKNFKVVFSFQPTPFLNSVLKPLKAPVFSKNKFEYFKYA